VLKQYSPTYVKVDGSSISAILLPIPSKTPQFPSATPSGLVFCKAVIPSSRITLNGVALIQGYLVQISLRVSRPGPKRPSQSSGPKVYSANVTGSGQSVPVSLIVHKVIPAPLR